MIHAICPLRGVCAWPISPHGASIGEPENVNNLSTVVVVETPIDLKHSRNANKHVVRLIFLIMLFKWTLIRLKSFYLIAGLNTGDESDLGDDFNGPFAQGDPCSKPITPGRCRGYFIRYGYDQNMGACRSFVYGGCGNNGNNFETLEECQSVCGN